MRNIKLVIEYDGGDFFGWQMQPDVPTVQARLQEALIHLTQQTVRLTAAGRTDTGVHAMGQVVNFYTASELPIETFVKGTNALLPPSIRVLSAEPVPESFHARFDAVSRTYRYVISRRIRAIGRQYSWYCPYALDVQAMHEACPALLGEHDFKAFCQAGTKLDHYRCLVKSAFWTEKPDELVFEITANRFVHNMVRILVGTFVEIGRGRIPPQDMKTILESGDRRRAGPTLPAHALFLMRVEYPQIGQDSTDSE